MASVQEVRKEQKGATGTMLNQTDMTIKLDRSHIWDGIHIGATFPHTISALGVGNFLHLKGNESGSKAMLQYSGVTAKGVACAWILAWDAPGDMMLGIQNKVYAIGGLKSDIDALTTDEILARLESGISPPGPVPNPNGAYAIITELPDMAAIEAGFYLNKV